MGIYESCNIFGIRIYNFNDNDFSNILFEQKYNSIMNDEQKKEAYLFYNQLNNKNNIFFNIYTECSSTHNIINKDTFMKWCPISLNIFLENFSI